MEEGRGRIWPTYVNSRRGRHFDGSEGWRIKERNRREIRSKRAGERECQLTGLGGGELN